VSGWSIFFRVAYRILRVLDRPLAWWVHWVGLGRVVELRVRGRRSGRARRQLVTLLSVRGDRYIGHPNDEAQWIRNLEAAGRAEVIVRDQPREIVRAVRLARGPERDEAIQATWTQQPLGADLVYRLARRYVAARGVYFRLDRDA
jgi:deazaflavin-dependent oxidoreductase (nitroreductase family)